MDEDAHQGAETPHSEPVNMDRELLWESPFKRAARQIFQPASLAGFIAGAGSRVAAQAFIASTGAAVPWMTAIVLGGIAGAARNAAVEWVRRRRSDISDLGEAPQSYMRTILGGAIRGAAFGALGYGFVNWLASDQLASAYRAFTGGEKPIGGPLLKPSGETPSALGNGHSNLSDRLRPTTSEAFREAFGQGGGRSPLDIFFDETPSGGEEPLSLPQEAGTPAAEETPSFHAPAEEDVAAGDAETAKTEGPDEAKESATPQASEAKPLQPPPDEAAQARQVDITVENVAGTISFTNPRLEHLVRHYLTSGHPGEEAKGLKAMIHAVNNGVGAPKNPVLAEQLARAAAAQITENPDMKANWASRQILESVVYYDLNPTTPGAKPNFDLAREHLRQAVEEAHEAGLRPGKWTSRFASYLRMDIG